MYMFVLGRILAPKDPEVLFSGKTVIVTGSNTGLGFEAAAKFIEKDAARVILAVRTVSKGEAAKQAIVDRHGHQDRIEVWELNMDSYDSIQKFVERANQLERLNIAMLNAGVAMTTYTASPYSWEETLQVNTISTTLLAILLLPKLKRSKTKENTPVLEFVNSGSHTRVDAARVKDGSGLLEEWNDEKSYTAQVQYGASKLLLMYATQVLAEMVDPSTTLITSVCPGFCASDLARGYNTGFVKSRVLFPIIYTISRTGEQGARTMVSGTTLGSEAHGRFWQHDKILPKIPLLDDNDSAQRQKAVWEDIIGALRKDFPQIDKAVEEVRSA